MYDADALVTDLNPRQAVRLSRGPALHHRHPMRPLPPSPPRCASSASHSTSIATLRTKARLKPRHSTTRITTRGLPSSTTTTSPFSAARRLALARATHCGGSGQLFRRNLFARRSPSEPILSLKMLTIYGNAIGVRAGCCLPFRSQTILIPRWCISTTRRGTFQQEVQG
ncbi:hypothetical protein B0H14DRAFT_1221651 [Mycena olivaceomarginata]|nr:hypothetical protein B0H14DRAFT_1221651 [Mycena olivaceomarginata]